MSRDLTGAWSGVFSYPADLPPTAFAASLREDAGALTGTIGESDLFTAGQPAIGAMVEGRRDGDSVRFVKYYDAPAGGYDSVAYEGVLAPDGEEITGRWDIPGEWSGTFLMVRETGVVEPADQEAEAVVDDPVPTAS